MANLKILLISTLCLTALTETFAEGRPSPSEPTSPSLQTERIDAVSGMDSVAAASKTTLSSTVADIVKKAAPTIKFGGLITGKYSASDRKGQASTSSFDLRYVRLHLSGTAFTDFYYRLQVEINDAPGNDKGPRVLDAFVEWQKFQEARIKLGQFKRPFGFENPMGPATVGLGSYSQASSKLASLNDRIGEHKSSGRDVGVQLQGDFFPAADGHRWLHYQVGLFNGQGINHKDRDNHKDLIGGLWISPIKGLRIGAFGWDGRYTNESYTAAVATTQRQTVRRTRWGAGISYDRDWIFRSEYMASVGGVATNINAATHSDAWYATLGTPLFSNLRLYGSWDCYRDNKSWSGLKTNYHLAGNYYLGKNLILQCTYTRTFDRSTSADRRYNTIDFQAYVVF